MQVSVRRALVTGAALLAVASTLGLGWWQWGRGEQKTQRQASIEARQSQPELAQAQWLADPASPQALFRTVTVRGEWVAQHTVFLDNRQMDARVGFDVVTPLRLSGSRRVVAVQRGWVPRDFHDRTRLPDVQTPQGEVTVHGRIAPPPPKLYELGTAPEGPIRQNLDLSAWRAQTGLDLLEGVSLQQIGAPSEGLLRQWPAAASGADRNFGYAFQWWSLAALILILYAWFEIIAPRRRARRA